MPIAPSINTSSGTQTATPSSSCKASFFTETLKVGQKDNQVKALQAILIDARYLSGTADGSFGPKTATALRAYQKANGVAVTGYVGPTVRAKLNQVWKNECLASDESVASDATIKADLTNASAQAVMYHDANNMSYTGVCTPGAVSANVHGVQEMVLAAANLSGITTVTTNGTGTMTSATCNESGTAWAAEAPLKDASLYCVDSVGAAKEEKVSIGSGTACL
jgi:peptidoglycan hydrolase-like protein with peptidoglycan-binding domain